MIASTFAPEVVQEYSKNDTKERVGVLLDSLLERVKERAIAAKEKAVEAKTRFVVGQARTERHTVRMFESKRSVKKRGRRILFATTKGKGLAVTSMITILACRKKLYRENLQRRCYSSSKAHSK